nr:radical SAM protein [Candidatus Sigynarchaeota archaeon]
KILMEHNSKENVIGVSSHSTANTRNTFYTVKFVKAYAPKATIVMGGYHATFFHKKWIKIGADVVIRHEGEVTFKTLVNKIKELQSGGTISEADLVGTTYSPEWLARINSREPASDPLVEKYQLRSPKAWKAIYDIPKFFYDRQSIVAPDRPFLPTLDDFPIPDRTKLDFTKDFYPMGNKGHVTCIESARGCPYSCEFCSTRTMWKESQRYKSIPKIIEEIKACVKMGIQGFLFVDESWGVNKKHAIGFMEALKAAKMHVTWAIQIRVDTIINNPDLVKMAGETGCRVAMVGFETVNQKTNDICNKKTSVRDFYKAKKILEGANIMSMSYFLTGLPDETRKDWRMTIEGSRTLSELAIIQPFIPYCRRTEEEARKNIGEDEFAIRQKFSIKDFNASEGIIKKTRALNRDISTYILRFALSPITIYRSLHAKTIIEKNRKRVYKHFYMTLFHLVLEFRPQNFLNSIRAINIASIYASIKAHRSTKTRNGMEK